MKYNRLDDIGVTLFSARIVNPTTVSGQYYDRSRSTDLTLVCEADGTTSTSAVESGYFGPFTDGNRIAGRADDGTLVVQKDVAGKAYKIPAGGSMAEAVQVMVPPLLYGSVKGINNHGQMIGSAMIDGRYQAIVSDGTNTSVIHPANSGDGASSSLNGGGGGFTSNMTYPTDINNNGTVVGTYTDTAGKVHGFVYANGGCRQIDIPNALNTQVTGVDDFGNIIGYYTDARGNERNFIGSDYGNFPFGTPLDHQGEPTGFFTVADQTTGQTTVPLGQHYTGPVSGVYNQCILITPDSLNITAQTPSTFIHTGSGTDAIDVAGVSGNNILDGASGSNFLVGGRGSDTFFLDDRGAAADIWSTVVGFHGGDAATAWGLDQAAGMSIVNRAGAHGYEGVTLIMRQAGQPTASLTFTGYSLSDIGTRLTISYGHTDDLPGLPGSSYLQVTGH